MDPDRTVTATSGVAIAGVQCIAIAGADARRFAQAQFAGDVRTLAPGHWQWNAWLDAGGRVEALLQLADPGDGTLLALLRGGDAARVQSLLVRYLLRDRVVLTTRVYAGCAGAPTAMGVVDRDGSDLIIGCGGRSLRLAMVRGELDARAAEAWRLADIRAGWPTLPDDAPRFLPPALGLERLGAVSFGKGCYPGQEIAARLHFRGGHKLRLQHVRGPAGLATGAHGDADGGRSPCVLDSVTLAGSSEALMVAPQSESRKIQVMGNEYDVISVFEP